MVCHEARRLFCWEVEGSDELKENLVQWLCRTTIWSQHLWRYRPVFVKSVTPAQEAKTVVANGAAVLTFTHQRWRAVSRHSNVPSVWTTSQSSGAALQRPYIRRTRPSSTHSVVCATLSVLRQPHLLVPGAALASVSAAAFMLLCAATAGAFGTVVVVHSPFELADGGFTRMSVFATLIVSAGVFTLLLVDFYFHFAGLQPAFEELQQQAAAAGVSLCLRGVGYTTGGRGCLTLRRQATSAIVQSVFCGHSSKVTRYRRC